jgi:hypothetical protein
MSMTKYIIGSIAALLLVIVAVAIVSSDASNIDIARPPSLEKLVLRTDPAQASPSPAGVDDQQQRQASPPPPGLGDWQYNAASFIADPLNRYAVYLLGRPSGDSPTGTDKTRLLFLAANRSRRDVEIQTAAIDQVLKEDKFPEALERLDGLIRSNPFRRQRIFDVLVAFTQNAASRQALVELLAQSPPWRKDFLTYLPRSMVDMQAASMLIAELRSTTSPPQPAELALFINKLINDGATDAAYALWLNSLSGAQLERTRYIYNGDFETKLGELGPFDWTIVPARNVVVRAVPNGAADRGSVLEVSFAGSAIRYSHISQRLMLPPGRYTLAGSYRANNLENDRGLVWRIYCMTTAMEELGESPAMKGTQDWSPFQIDFSVPDIDCPSQLLRLDLNARAKLDMRVRGVLRFDDLRIDRQE